MRTLTVISKVLLYLAIYICVVLFTNWALNNWIQDDEFSAWLSKNPASSLIAANTIVIAIYVPLLRWQNIRMQDLGFVRPQSAVMAAGTGIWLGLFIAVFTQLGWIAENFPEIANLVQFVAGGGNFYVFVLSSLLLGSLLEELLFRGMLIHVFRQRFSSAWSVLLQALLFGTVFMSVTIGAFAALGAIIYGVIRVTTGSIWSSLLAHVFSTATLYVVSHFMKDSSPETFLILSFISGIAIIVHLYILLRRQSENLKRHNKSITS